MSCRFGGINNFDFFVSYPQLIPKSSVATALEKGLQPLDVSQNYQMFPYADTTVTIDHGVLELPQPLESGFYRVGKELSFVHWASVGRFDDHKNFSEGLKKNLAKRTPNIQSMLPNFRHSVLNKLSVNILPNLYLDEIPADAVSRIGNIEGYYYPNIYSLREAVDLLDQTVESDTYHRSMRGLRYDENEEVAPADSQKSKAKFKSADNVEFTLKNFRAGQLNLVAIESGEGGVMVLESPLTWQEQDALQNRLLERMAPYQVSLTRVFGSKVLPGESMAVALQQGVSNINIFNDVLVPFVEFSGQLRHRRPPENFTEHQTYFILNENRSFLTRACTAITQEFCSGLGANQIAYGQAPLRLGNGKTAHGCCLLLPESSDVALFYCFSVQLAAISNADRN